MNKTITTALVAVRANPTDTALVAALRDLAVPKFKTINGKIQSAVKSINRHIGEGKGTPNRAKMAEAIGLRTMVTEYGEVATLIGMPEMTDAVLNLTQIINAIEGMRKTRTYTHVGYLPDFLTDAEKAEKKVNDAKLYLYNIIGAVNRAAVSINNHVNSGDLDPNTFKIAKALGYEDELATLTTEFNALPNATTELVTEIAYCALATASIGAIKASVNVGNTIPVPLVPDYDPFPNALFEDFTEGDELIDEE